MKPPPGIADWTTARFRRWAGGRIEGHTDQLGRLLKIVSGQNEIIRQLRRRQEILTQKVDQLPRPGSPRWLATTSIMCGPETDEDRP